MKPNPDYKTILGAISASTDIDRCITQLVLDKYTSMYPNITLGRRILEIVEMLSSSDFRQMAYEDKSVGASICSYILHELTRKFSSSRSSMLYLIRYDDTHYYKIGVTVDTAHKRAMSMQVGTPFQLHVYSQCFCINAGELEYAFHDLFKDSKIRGEWFELDSNDIEYIKTECLRFELTDHFHQKSEKSWGLPSAQPQMPIVLTNPPT